MHVKNSKCQPLKTPEPLKKGFTIRSCTICAFSVRMIFMPKVALTRFLYPLHLKMPGLVHMSVGLGRARGG